MFSFYLTYTGISSVKHNKAQYKVKNLDWFALTIIGISGVAMVGFSIYYLIQYDFVFATLYGVFGFLSLNLFYGDYKSFIKWKVSPPKKIRGFIIIWVEYWVHTLQL